tara:strand:+ start:114 stop:224 length:111 start_codon:yes stop_codon:yes gene_type:complete
MISKLKNKKEKKIKKKLHKGPKGGKYYMKDGKKYYI